MHWKSPWNLVKQGKRQQGMMVHCAFCSSVASFYWPPLESIYWTNWRFCWLSPVVFSSAEIITIPKAGWQCSGPTFQGTEKKKNPRDFVQMLLSLMRKMVMTFLPICNWIKLSRHHSDENSEHPISSSEHQHKNCFQNHRAGNDLNKLLIFLLHWRVLLL